MREPMHRPEVDENKSPHERFNELGKRLMAVPKPELDAEEEKWQRGRAGAKTARTRKRK
jgi:hypothetical protein